MSKYPSGSGSWRTRNRPYIYAIVLAIVMTMFIAPEMMEGDSMSPAVKDGQMIIVTKQSYSAKRGKPDLGRVIVMEKQISQKISDDNIVARVVGLPGDTVSIRNGVFYRNGKEYKVKGASGKLGRDMTKKIDKDHVFILCDNRDIKLDSRAKKLGPVSMRKIEGNAKWIIWPFSDMGAVK